MTVLSRAIPYWLIRPLVNYGEVLRFSIEQFFRGDLSRLVVNRLDGEALLS